MKTYDIKETITNEFELPCYDRCESFYGKARVIETEKGRYLQSYDTIVCYLSYGGSFVKLWDNYSVTTMRHINSFMDFVRWNHCGGKKWWDTLEVGEIYNYNQFVS